LLIVTQGCPKVSGDAATALAFATAVFCMIPFMACICSATINAAAAAFPAFVFSSNKLAKTLNV